MQFLKHFAIQLDVKRSHTLGFQTALKEQSPGTKRVGLKGVPIIRSRGTLTAGFPRDGELSNKPPKLRISIYSGLDIE
jgi:hypothetical protein